MSKSIQTIAGATYVVECAGDCVVMNPETNAAVAVTTAEKPQAGFIATRGSYEVSNDAAVVVKSFSSAASAALGGGGCECEEQFTEAQAEKLRAIAGFSSSSTSDLSLTAPSTLYLEGDGNWLTLASDGLKVANTSYPAYLKLGSNSDRLCVLPLGATTALGADAYGLSVSADGGLQLWGTHFLQGDVHNDRTLKVVHDSLSLGSTDTAAIGFDYANNVVFRTMPNDGSTANDSAGGVYRFEAWQWADDSHTSKKEMPVDVRKPNAGVLCDESLMNRAEVLAAIEEHAGAQFTGDEVQNLRDISARLNVYEARDGFVLDGGEATSYIQVDSGGMIIHNRGADLCNFGHNNVISLGNASRPLYLTGSTVTINGTDISELAGGSDIPIAADKMLMTAPVASGSCSTALGYNVSASGTYSTALGHTASASGNDSTALGYTASASGAYSTAVGDNAQATNNRAVAIGYTAVAKGLESTVVGYYSSVSSAYAISLGCRNAVSSSYTTALGYRITVRDAGVTVISAWDSMQDTQTLLYLIGANSPLANTYENGAACMGYVVKDTSGNVLECGTRKLSEIFTNNTAFAPASMDLDAPAPTPFMPTGITDPIEFPEDELPEGEQTEA